MSSIYKHANEGFVACYLAKRLCSESPALLEFVRYGATTDKIARRSSTDTKDLFPNLLRDVLKKEGRKVNKAELLDLGREILCAAGQQANSSMATQVNEEYIKSFVSEILKDTLIVELHDELETQL